MDFAERMRKAMTTQVFKWCDACQKLAIVPVDEVKRRTFDPNVRYIVCPRCKKELGVRFGPEDVKHDA